MIPETKTCCPSSLKEANLGSDAYPQASLPKQHCMIQQTWQTPC